MHHDDHDLCQENDRMAAEIRARGGAVDLAPDLDSALAGRFLQRVLAYEEADPAPLRSVFPDLDALPAPEELDEAGLACHLDRIERILERHGMTLELQPGVPAAAVYRFLVEDYIPTATLPAVDSDDCCEIIDGCSGWCDEPCFQREYCGLA